MWMKIYKYYLKSKSSNDSLFIGTFSQMNPSRDIDDSFVDFIVMQDFDEFYLELAECAIHQLNFIVVGVDEMNEESTLLEYDQELSSYFGRETTMKYFGIQFIAAA